MSTKDSNLKEKFRIALNSTAKVISDDFDLNKKNLEEKKAKDIISLEIDNLTYIKHSGENDYFDTVLNLEELVPRVRLVSLFRKFLVCDR